MSTNRSLNTLIIFGLLAIGASTLQPSTMGHADIAWVRGFFVLLAASITTIAVIMRIRVRSASFTPTRIRAIFDNTTQGIILTNDKGKIILSNPAASSMFGYSSEELQGQPIELLIPGRFQDGHIQYRDYFNQQPANRDMGPGRNIFARKKGGREFAVEVSLSHYRERGALFIIAFVIDITQRKLAEQELVERRDQLERITKSINRLHAELETRVEQRTLILRAALQEMEYSQRALSSALQHEKKLTEYLNGQLEALLLYGAMQLENSQPEKAEFAMETLLTEIVSEVGMQLGEGLSIQYDCDACGLIAGDRRLIKIILTNLLGLFVQSSSHGATILLAGSKPRPEELVISVTDPDNGLPIADAGVALHLVKKYTHMLGGSVQYNSAQQTGASVLIRLPATPMPE